MPLLQNRNNWKPYIILACERSHNNKHGLNTFFDINFAELLTCRYVSEMVVQWDIYGILIKDACYISDQPLRLINSSENSSNFAQQTSWDIWLIYLVWLLPVNTY